MADIVWRTTRLPDAIAGVPYEASLAATGNATAFTAASVGTGTKPANLAFSADFVRITGTPLKSDVGQYTFTVSLTDTAGAVVSGSFNLNVRYNTPADDVTLIALGQKAAADNERLWPV